MRILIVTPHYWPEPFRVTDVAAGLKARGHDIEVLTNVPNYPEGHFYKGYGVRGPWREKHDGVQITRAPTVPRGSGGGARLLLNYLSFAIFAGFRALWLGRQRWDVVFVFQTSPVTAAMPALLIRALFGTPVAIWVQDLWPDSVLATGFGGWKPLYSAARTVSRWIYTRCDRVAGTSQAFRARLAELGVDPDRFDYLPQWAEEFFKPKDGSSAPEIDLSDDSWSHGFPILFAGNLGRVQSLETVLDAADLLRNDGEVRWVFLGEGSRREWLEAESRRRGLDKKVFLLGRRQSNHMPAYFAKAGALLVSLSGDEGMALIVPAKVQSYLAAGRPILASLDGEGARIVEESGAGWAAPAGDAVALATIVTRMKETPHSLRMKMGERGRKYCAKHFARDICLERLERVLEDAIAQEKSSAASPQPG